MFTTYQPLITGPATYYRKWQTNIKERRRLESGFAFLYVYPSCNKHIDSGEYNNVYQHYQRDADMRNHRHIDNDVEQL